MKFNNGNKLSATNLSYSHGFFQNIRSKHEA